MSFIAGLISWIADGGWAIVAGAGAVAFWLLDRWRQFRKGEEAGRDQVVREVERARMEDIQHARQIDSEGRRAGPDDARDFLRDRAGDRPD